MKLTQEQYDALEEYIEAKIDERIESAFGRDSLNESIRLTDADNVLRGVILE